MFLVIVHEREVHTVDSLEWGQARSNKVSAYYGEYSLVVESRKSKEINLYNDCTEIQILSIHSHKFYLHFSTELGFTLNVCHKRQMYPRYVTGPAKIGYVGT